LFALGIRTTDQDAFASGRANAFTATADNAAAVYYNPAGIMQLDGQNFIVGASGSIQSSHFENGTTSIDSKTRFRAAPQVYYTFKLPEQPIAFGVGIYSPFGLAVEWPDSSIFRAQATRSEINYYTLNPVIAYQVLPTLSIAAGATINYADADFRNIPFGISGDSFRFHGDDTAFGFNAGILWHPLEKHSFGVTYRHSTDMNFEGQADTSLVPPASFIPTSKSFPATANFAFPSSVTAGYSFRPTPDWNLEVDIDWTDWSSQKGFTVVKADGNQTLLSSWRSSWMYEFGGTRFFKNGWSVSGGYSFSQNSVPDSSFSAFVPDTDCHTLSAGVGKTYKKMSWNAGYQVGISPTRTISGLTGNNAGANGNYDSLSHTFALNFGYHF